MTNEEKWQRAERIIDYLNDLVEGDRMPELKGIEILNTEAERLMMEVDPEAARARLTPFWEVC